jgi:peptidoglycan hydrolase CwlO-like protein
MKIIFKKIFPIFLGCWLLFIFSTPISLAITAEECEIKLGKGQLSLDEAKECEAILNKLYQEAGEQKRSLQNEITKFNTAIAITTTRIYTTIGQIEVLEKEIATLTAKIGRLDVSLDQLSQILIKRIAETYKKGKIEPITLFFSSSRFSEFISRYKYLRVIQLHDRKLMIQMESVRTSFEDQKTLKEKKQDELEAAKKKLEEQKILLAQQKADKENLLRITQNNELRYQQLLAASRAEIEAIQGIIAGRGQEIEVGKVGQGNMIATIITGSSACSTGTHLHFQIAEGSDVKNPFNYLKGNINYENCSGSRCGSGDGDAFNPTGNWEWPLNEPIRFNQGFGSDTSAIRSRIVWYDFHTGIDIVSDDRTIKSVKSGTLYRGSIACGGGTLRYVRVDHDDSGIDTYYLHVNY